MSNRSRIRIIAWILAAVLGAAQAWISRFDLVNDTVSYLDMGDYFFHGHPAAIINGIWSPLYAFLLGLTVTVFRTTIYSEYPVIHLLLFVIFLFALYCFEYFIRQLESFHNAHTPRTPDFAHDWAWTAIAYVLFLWASLGLIGVYETNPDMLIAAFFYLACGFLLKIAAGHATWKTFCAFGVTLGLGYLTKSVMFPLSIALLLVAAILAKREPRRILIAVSAFFLLALPFIGMLSAQKGHLTFGDSGKYNYAVHINQVPRHHWQGSGSAFGAPVHPTREISAWPTAFEFNGPLPGTYPAWYDPTFWYEGVQPHVHLRQELKAFGRNAFGEFDIFFLALNGTLFTTLLVSFIASKDRIAVWKSVYRTWFLVIIPILAFCLYAAVHYENRYIGSFFVVLCVSLFSCILSADDPSNRQLFSGIAVVQIFMLLWLFAPPMIRHVWHPWVQERGSYQEIAEGAREMGLRPGDPIASLDFSNLGTVMWARLARVRIIGEVYYWPGNSESTTSFWSADAFAQENLLQKFQQAGAKAVVTSDTPVGANASKWLRIGHTGEYILWLNQQAKADSFKDIATDRLSH